jgi:hypothetical protein|tara:strand:+ start:1891 stop:2253 length:363 start_codon:yes stop_codon:yes gene_type:complete
MKNRPDLERNQKTVDNALSPSRIPDSKIRSVKSINTKSKNNKVNSTYRRDIEETSEGESTSVITKKNKRGKVTNTLINPDNTGYKDVTTSKGKKRGHKTSKIINKARVKKSKKILDETDK